MIKLEEALQTLKIPYTPQMLAQFAAYMDGVLTWNEKVNLTRITEHDEFVIKHFIDSVICSTNAGRQKQLWMSVPEADFREYRLPFFCRINNSP